MKKVIIIAIPFVIGILAILLTIFLNSNKNEVVVKNEKQNVVSTMEDSDYFVEEVVNDKSEKRINQTTKKVKTTTTKTKESVNEVNKTTTSSKASSVLTTTKKDTTTKTTITTTTKKITTSTSSCYEGKFHTSFFRSDFKNDDNACFLKGTELSEKTNGKHIFECEYEFDDCGIKHWMLIMYDENDKQYYYKNFEKLYPEYK